MIEKFVFVTLLTGFAGINIYLTIKKKRRMFAVMFGFTLLVGAAFYLFQWGPLGTFTLKALSAEASFVRDKAAEVKEDAKAVSFLRDETEKQASALKALVNRLKESEDQLSTIKENIIQMERLLVEVEFLNYAGRNRFPNPYHERVMTNLDQMFTIAIPDQKQREAYINDLAKYTQGNQLPPANTIKP